jgi:hypothetical protein
MPAPKRSKIQRERDRATISTLYLQGWTQQRIAEYMESYQIRLIAHVTIDMCADSC